MAVKNIFHVYPASLDGTVIPIVAQSISPGMATRIVGVNGTVDPAMIYGESQQPVLSFTTPAIKAVLDKIATPWQGFSIATAFAFYLQAHTAFGGRATTGFQKLNLTAGLVIPRRISASNGPLATISCDVFPISTDGETSPLVHTTGVADPLLSTSIADGWTVGPVKINSASLDANNYTGVQSTEIDFGISAQPRGGDGALFPTFIGIDEVRPTIQVGLSDGLVLSQLGLSGLKQDANDSTVFLRKVVAGGTRVLLETATHLSFAAAGGIIVSDPLSGSHGSAVPSSFAITPVLDTVSGNPQLVYNNGTAIN